MLAALLLAGCGGSTGDSPGHAADPAELALRLTDLPQGWRVTDRPACGPMGNEGATDAVSELIASDRPTACSASFVRVWGDSKPFYVSSVILAFSSDEGAEDALPVAGDFLKYFGPLDRAEAAPLSVPLGDEAKGFVQPDAYMPGPQPSPGAAVAWRSGRLLAIVAAGARAQADASAAALEYARKQQARIEAPTPAAGHDYDDAFVALDNPNLDVPVWWLGPTFDPPDPLPPVALEEAQASSSSELPGQSVDLTYRSESSVRPGGGAWIFLWKPASWQKWTKLHVGQIGWKSPCARSTTIHVPAGRAVIWRTYWDAPQTGPCPVGPPDVAFAHVYGDGVVITVDIPICTMCRPPAEQTAETLKWLEPVVRGLRRR